MVDGVTYWCSFALPTQTGGLTFYGGSLENRMRFPLEVVRAVKEAVGDFPVGYRLKGANRFDRSGPRFERLQRTFKGRISKDY